MWYLSLTILAVEKKFVQAICLIFFLVDPIFETFLCATVKETVHNKLSIIHQIKLDTAFERNILKLQGQIERRIKRKKLKTFRLVGLVKSALSNGTNIFHTFDHRKYKLSFRSFFLLCWERTQSCVCLDLYLLEV